MKIKKFYWFVLSAWMISVMACGLPLAEPQAILPAVVSPSLTPPENPTAAPRPTEIPITTSTPSPSPTAAFTFTPIPVDMSKATLKLADFPAGFNVLDEAAQAQLGMTPETLSQPFVGIFRQASPVIAFAFANAESKSFEIVIGMVFYPLTTHEQAAFDQMLSDPTATMQNFSQGFGGQAQLQPALAKIGNSSVGWEFLSASSQAKLKGEMVMFRRENAVGLLLTLFQAEQKPPSPAAMLAPILDKRILSGLGHE